jgi:hypothetical protein
MEAKQSVLTVLKAGKPERTKEKFGMVYNAVTISNFIPCKQNKN